MQSLEAAFGPDFSGAIIENEPLSAHTTMRIGGPARYFVRPANLRSLIIACETARNLGIPWTCMGKGSNLLVSDAGFNGMVLTLGAGFEKFSYDEENGVISAGAGLRLSHAVRKACELSRCGLEFAVGIPGTIGGALRMNAGTRREFIGPAVLSVTTLRPGVGLRRYIASDIEWSYRNSSIPFDEVVLECELQTHPGEAGEIRRVMQSAQARRRVTQPLGLPSCGSVFRNPEGESVGRLIENAGFKGALCGGAQISDVHANFIVNRGGASAAEVLSLIHAVREGVLDRYGIDLECEVRFLGF